MKNMYNFNLRKLKQFISLLLLSFIVFACNNAKTPTVKSFMMYNVEVNAEDILCDGNGLSFGNCVAKQMKTGKCIGIANHEGTHIAIEIPCDLMFKSALDTLDYDGSESFEELLEEY